MEENRNFAKSKTLSFSSQLHGSLLEKQITILPTTNRVKSISSKANQQININSINKTETIFRQNKKNKKLREILITAPCSSIVQVGFFFTYICCCCISI